MTKNRKRKNKHNHDSGSHIVIKHKENKKAFLKNDDIDLKKNEVQPLKQNNISWRAAEFHYIEKDYLWYVGVIAVGAVLIISSLWQHNFFFAVFLIIATILVVEFGKRRPEILEYELNDNGVVIDGILYAQYRNIISFHIRKRFGYLDELILHRNSKIRPFLHLPIDDKLAIKARDFLLNYIPEDDHEQSFADIIAERLGF